MVVISLILVLVVVISIKVGAVSISMKDLLEMLKTEEMTSKQKILVYVRMPRVIAALMAGAAFAVSGTIIQTVLQNPMAGPNIIGVNAGASFFVVLCSTLLPQSVWLFPLAAFIGALLTMLFVYTLGKLTGASKTTLIMAGIAVNSLLNAASDMIFTLDSDILLNSTAFKIGGLSGVSVPVLIPAGMMILLALGSVLGLHNELEVLSLGDETAKSLGLPIGRYRLIFLGLAAVLAGAAVSFSGLIGFVGLIVPHIARLLVGTGCKEVLKMSMVLGAAFLCFCDLIARVLFAPYEVSVGIILSFIGAPFFLYLLINRRKRSMYD